MIVIVIAMDNIDVIINVLVVNNYAIRILDIKANIFLIITEIWNIVYLLVLKLINKSI